MLDFWQYWLRVAGLARRHTNWLTPGKAVSSVGIVVLREVIGAGAGFRSWGAVGQTVALTAIAYAAITTLDYLRNFVRAPMLLDHQREQENSRLREGEAAVRGQIDAMAVQTTLWLDQELVPLPATIRAGSILRTLHLHPEHPDPGLQVMANPNTSDLTITRSSSFPIAARYTVRNGSKETLLVVILGYRVVFFRGGKLVSEAVVAEHQDELHIPPLAPDESFEFYAENVSDFTVSLWPPILAAVQIGAGQPQVVQALRSQKSPTNMPNVLLPPARGG